jgi:shikimate dehydrogenase
MSATRAFVLGWPAGHSRSPLIHRFWLARHGIDGDYLREAVPPDSVGAFLASLAKRGYVGGNVTVPHKEAAFRACAELTEVARRLEAANTVWLEGGVLCGDNTDVYGFAANLDEYAPAWRSARSMLVLGAGGSSRAVIHAALQAGLAVVVLNRTPARAMALAAHFGERVRAGGLDELPRMLPAADIVVNATSAGLGGSEALAVDWRAARPDAIVTDLVYVPLMTPFLGSAGERGLTIVDGLGMLLHQAVPGFERWFGVRPQVDAELRSLVTADLTK